jgi:putative protein-disulfide isomerase
LLAEGTYISNSEPPCRAIVVMQQLAPAGAYTFADAIPEAFYVRGLRPDDPHVLAELASANGADPEAFLQGWHSDAAREATQAAFALARGEGFVSYPTLVYRRGDAITIVARGFLPPADAVARVAELRGRSAA